MKIQKAVESQFILIALLVVILTTCTNAEIIYVDSRNGDDGNPGTLEKPLRTIGKAAVIVNSKTKAEPTTIKIGPGIHNLTNSVIFENSHQYTEKDRLIIEASILPDNPQWKPYLMPVILSTENPCISEKLTETYSLKVKRSYATIRGLKFLGNPLSNNWHACVERTGKDLEDLLITQCMFVGDKDSFNIYCAAIATGNRFVVDHCIFRNCHASIVYWDGLEGIGGKGCAMRYCIVDGSYISGVWTCQTAEDFEFHHNIVTGCDYFWMRKPGDQMTYKLHDCIVTNNKHYSGYGVETGATGQTGPEVTYKENNVVKTGQVVIEEDKSKNSYLHVVPGTLGNNLGAGLFTKSASEKDDKKAESVVESSVILYITYRDKWDQALNHGEYHPKSLNTEGYIHCSKPSQIIRVANHLFKGQKGLVLLVIYPKEVKPKIKWEGKEETNLYPHIYGPLNLDAVKNVLDFSPSEDGTFELPERIQKVE